MTLLAVYLCLQARPANAVEPIWRIAGTLACLGGIGIFHPLMAIYATGWVLLVLAAGEPGRRRFYATSALGFLALLLGAAVRFSQRHGIETADHNMAVLTRSYYFLSRWAWYEQVGLIAPLMLGGLYCGWRGSWGWERGRDVSWKRDWLRENRPDVTLAYATVALGILSTTVCLVFATPGSRSHLVAMLQPMRPLIFVYYSMFLLLGGLLGGYVLRRAAWRWMVLAGVLGTTMYFVQRSTYPASAQVELPGVLQKNPWIEAFLWIKANTAVDAVVAMDAHYIQAEGEDAQGFRGIAERSSLADFSKDGGSSSIFPQLASKWMVEHTAQMDLSRMDDAERRRRLEPLGVHWLVLQRAATTELECPYRNAMVEVCRLP